MTTSTLPIPAIRKRAPRTYPCPHIHTTITTTGTLRFVAGDISDTLEDRLICVDCGECLDDLPRQAQACEQNAVLLLELA